MLPKACWISSSLYAYKAAGTVSSELRFDFPADFIDWSSFELSLLLLRADRLPVADGGYSLFSSSELLERRLPRDASLPSFCTAAEL